MEEKKRTKPDFTAIYRDIPKVAGGTLGKGGRNRNALALCFNTAFAAWPEKWQRLRETAWRAEAVSFAVNQSGSQHQYDELVDLEKAMNWAILLR